MRRDYLIFGVVGALAGGLFGLWQQIQYGWDWSYVTDPPPTWGIGSEVVYILKPPIVWGVILGAALALAPVYLAGVQPKHLIVGTLVGAGVGTFFSIVALFLPSDGPFSITGAALMYTFGLCIPPGSIGGAVGAALLTKIANERASRLQTKSLAAEIHNAGIRSAVFGGAIGAVVSSVLMFLHVVGFMGL
jgi:hypothetical protein